MAAHTDGARLPTESDVLIQVCTDTFSDVSNAVAVAETALKRAVVEAMEKQRVTEAANANLKIELSSAHEETERLKLQTTAVMDDAERLKSEYAERLKSEYAERLKSEKSLREQSHKLEKEVNALKECIASKEEDLNWWKGEVQNLSKYGSGAGTGIKTECTRPNTAARLIPVKQMKEEGVARGPRAIMVPVASKGGVDHPASASRDRDKEPKFPAAKPKVHAGGAPKSSSSTNATTKQDTLPARGDLGQGGAPPSAAGLLRHSETCDDGNSKGSSEQRKRASTPPGGASTETVDESNARKTCSNPLSSSSKKRSRSYSPRASRLRRAFSPDGGGDASPVKRQRHGCASSGEECSASRSAEQSTIAADSAAFDKTSDERPPTKHTEERRLEEESCPAGPVPQKSAEHVWCPQQGSKISENGQHGRSRRAADGTSRAARTSPKVVLKPAAGH